MKAAETGIVESWMSMEGSGVSYFRHLWRDPGLIIVSGDVREIMNGRADYNRRYGVPSDDAEIDGLLERLFAGAILAAVSLVARESWGWSLGLPGRRQGLFCAVEPEGMVCGAVVASDHERATAVVQRQKTRCPLTQSHFDITQPDPLRAVEAYFDEAAQNPARAALDASGRAVMVLPLPGGRFDLVRTLSDAELIGCCDAELAGDSALLLEEVRLFYACRCSDEMILDMITGLPEEQRQELWKDAPALEVTCPRCARPFRITRRQ